MTDAPAYALFIAIDWADDHHDLCLIDPATQPRAHQTVTHDPTGYMAGWPTCTDDIQDNGSP